MTIRIEVTVEPRGRSGGTLSEIIEVDDSEVAGLDPGAREAVLAQIAEDAASEMAPWGWREL